MSYAFPRGLGAGPTLDTYAGTTVPKYKTTDRDYDYTWTWWIPDQTIEDLDALMSLRVGGVAVKPDELNLSDLHIQDTGGETLSNWLKRMTVGGTKYVVLMYDNTTRGGVGSSLWAVDPSYMSRLAQPLPGWSVYVVARPDLGPPSPDDAFQSGAININTRPVARGPYWNPPRLDIPGAHPLPDYPPPAGSSGISTTDILLILAGCVGAYMFVKRNGGFRPNAKTQHEWDKWTRDWETDRSNHSFILAQQWKDRGELAGPRKKRSHYPAHRHHREYPLIDTYKDKDDMRGLLYRLHDHEAAERTSR